MESRETLTTLLSNSLLLASSLKGAFQWRLATHRVEASQRKVLLRIIRSNCATAFGREHGFSGIRSVPDFQSRVPVRGYEELESYVDRAAAGEQAVLTKDPVQSFALSSGSSVATKRIPYTQSLLDDFRRGISPWLAGLYLQHPSLLLGKSYWQVSPVGAPQGSTSGGIPIGFGQDSEYFGRYRGALVRATLAVPEHVAGIAGLDTFRFETLRHLLACRNLRFLSIWNPSFLTLLLAQASELWPALIQQMKTDGLTNRAGELLRICDEYHGDEFTQRNSRGLTLGEAIWPKLRVISCWCDAAAHGAALRLQTFFPNVTIQPKGLIATEGIISLPWRAQSGALALRSHFFEFLEVGTGQVRLAHELQTGAKYSVILTTSGGLYRYRIGDVIEITGWIGRCPVLRFCGKETDVSDLVGEKLNSIHVARAAEAVFAFYKFVPAFWMVTPEQGDPAPWYTLYLQSESDVPDGLVSALDTALGENFHYGYARRIGQLAPLKLFRIDPRSTPETDYLRAQAARGRRLGGIKSPQFDRATGWSEVFTKSPT